MGTYWPAPTLATRCTTTDVRGPTDPTGAGTVRASQNTLAFPNIEYAFLAIPEPHYIEGHRTGFGALSTKGFNDVDT